MLFLFLICIRAQDVDRYCSPSVARLLVGTKSDLQDKRWISSADAKVIVSQSSIVIKLYDSCLLQEFSSPNT